MKFFEPQSQRKKKRGRPRLLALAVASAATSTLANAQSIDLLGGHGTFTTQAEMEEHWRPQLETTSEVYDVSVAEGELRLRKKDAAKVNFDDGVFYHLDGAPKPQHL